MMMMISLSLSAQTISMAGWPTRTRTSSLVTSHGSSTSMLLGAPTASICSPSGKCSIAKSSIKSTLQRLTVQVPGKSSAWTSTSVATQLCSTSLLVRKVTISTRVPELSRPSRSGFQKSRGGKPKLLRLVQTSPFLRNMHLQPMLS